MGFPEQEAKKKDCPEVICEKSDPLGTYRKFAQKQEAKPLKFKDELDNNGAEDTSAEPAKQEDDPYRFCPNNKQSMGFFTWNLLHSMAIYYPQKPTEDEKQKMKNFFESFAIFYPCKPCAIHFQMDIKKNPPAVENNETLSMWVCERHNLVNKWLGKPIFDCDFQNLEKRWRTGYEQCKEIPKEQRLQ